MRNPFLRLEYWLLNRLVKRQKARDLEMYRNSKASDSPGPKIEPRSEEPTPEPATAVIVKNGPALRGQNGEFYQLATVEEQRLLRKRIQVLEKALIPDDETPTKEE